MRNRPSTDSPKLSWLARALAVLVTAAILVTAPGIAQAAFTGKAKGQVSAATLNLSTLTAASATSTCTRNDDLKIQLTDPVDGANYHRIVVKLYGYALYTGELNAANSWTYQRSAGYNLNYTYEITAQYQVRVKGNLVNTWTGATLTESQTC